VGQQFTLPVARHGAAGLNGLGLGAEHLGRTLGTFAQGAPAAAAQDGVNVVVVGHNALLGSVDAVEFTNQNCSCQSVNQRGGVMIGNRLKRAREALGLSLRDLEAAIQGQVSAQAIGKYERDEMMPGSAVLLSLARALDVSPEYLLSERAIELAGVDFRKAPHAGVKEERAVEASVLDQVERYLELEELFPQADLAWDAPADEAFEIHRVEDAEEAAEALRRLWKLGIDPIPFMAELLEDRGVKVIALELPENVSGSKAFVQRPEHNDVPVIVVNQGHNGERQRFTLAHELAHLVLRFGGLSEAEQEKAADRFAGAFLVAKDMLLQLMGGNRTAVSIGELADLKKTFQVSLAALAVRCSQLGILSKAAYGRLWGQIKNSGWNSQASDEPNPLPPEVPRRMERLCMRAVAEGAISDSRAAELLNISVREFDRRLSGHLA
jgi:Zn-dependent peptidase ImmA (M78 family)/DNA-binding XRE family transcriptional regulator